MLGRADERSEESVRAKRAPLSLASEASLSKGFFVRATASAFLPFPSPYPRFCVGGLLLLRMVESAPRITHPGGGGIRKRMDGRETNRRTSCTTHRGGGTFAPSHVAPELLIERLVVAMLFVAFGDCPSPRPVLLPHYRDSPASERACNRAKRCRGRCRGSSPGGTRLIRLPIGAGGWSGRSEALSDLLAGCWPFT